TVCRLLLMALAFAAQEMPTYCGSGPPPPRSLGVNSCVSFKKKVWGLTPLAMVETSRTFQNLATRFGDDKCFRVRDISRVGHPPQHSRWKRDMLFGRYFLGESGEDRRAGSFEF